MTFIPYEPPKPEFADTMLAFQVIAGGPRVGALIEPDPLGPVNKIVTLVVGDRRVKSVLCPVGVGTVVTVGREPGAWSLEGLFALRDRRWNGENIEPPDAPRPPGWFVEVDGRRIIEVPEHETRPPVPEPPPIPWYRRARRALAGAVRQQIRADLDAIAERLGYHRDDECGADW